MSDSEKDVWEMKHRPDWERLACIYQILESTSKALQDQRREELLELAAPSLLSNNHTAVTGDATSVVFVVSDANPAFMPPTTCSTGYPSHDIDAPASSTAATDVFIELAAPVASNAAHDVGALSLAAPTPATYSTLGPDHGTGRVDQVGSLIPASAPTTATAPSEPS